MSNAKRKPRKAIDVEAVLAGHAAGDSNAEIARRLDVSESGVGRIVKRADSAAKEVRRKPRTPIDHAAVGAAIAAGESITSIAERLGVSVSGVGYAAKRAQEIAVPGTVTTETPHESSPKRRGIGRKALEAFGPASPIAEVALAFAERLQSLGVTRFVLDLERGTVEISSTSVTALPPIKRARK